MADVDRTSQKPQVRPTGWVDRGVRLWRGGVPEDVRAYVNRWRRRWDEGQVLREIRGGPSGHTRGPLIVSGYFGDSKGISEAARLTAEGLEGAGFKLHRHDISHLFQRPFGSDREENFDRPGGVWLTHCNPPEAIALFARLGARRWSGRYRIGYWAYELPAIPDDWVRAAELFDEIWAPSRFVLEAIRSAGVRTPLRWMPHPVGLRRFDKHRSLTGSPDNSVTTILVMGDLLSSGVRKNLLGAVEIYRRAFPDPTTSARLIIKCQSHEGARSFMVELEKRIGVRPDIECVSSRMTRNEVVSLIGSSDILLSPHRSEGFGLSLAEAFMMGVAPLATGWSGNLEFMSGLDELLIDFSMVRVEDQTGVYPSGELLWAEPDVIDAATKLRRLATSPGLREDLVRRGRSAVMALSDSWSPKALDKMPMCQWIENT